MLGTVGDLVEDVVVRLRTTINVASDTDAVVHRRRGGSAANMAVAVARAGGRSRFIGQVGDDPLGALLADMLTEDGVEACVRRGGRTGTVVVLVDHAGERTMLSDRAACADLDRPDPAWLDGLDTLHVPFYSLSGGALAGAAETLVGWAHERGLRVSIDASSSAVLEHHGVAAAGALLARLRPSVLLCNEMEAATLGGLDGLRALGAPVTIVKRGASSTLVMCDGASGAPPEVPVIPIDAVRDTTGAGDAFAAGLLLALSGGADLLDAVAHAHGTAADAIRRVSADAEREPWA